MAEVFWYLKLLGVHGSARKRQVTTGFVLFSLLLGAVSVSSEKADDEQRLSKVAEETIKVCFYGDLHFSLPCATRVSPSLAFSPLDA